MPYDVGICKSFKSNLYCSVLCAYGLCSELMYLWCVGLINRLSWMESAYPHVNTDVGCFKTSVGFVDHLTEALGPLLAGIPIIIPSPEILKENLLILLNYIQVG